MNGSINQIFEMIKKEAGTRHASDQAAALHGVMVEVSLAVGEAMKQIREVERNENAGHNG